MKQTRKQPDTWKRIGIALANTPNGAPKYHCANGETEGYQCLLCYNFHAGKNLRHKKSCPYIRARALGAASRKGG